MKTVRINTPVMTQQLLASPLEYTIGEVEARMRQIIAEEWSTEQFIPQDHHPILPDGLTFDQLDPYMVQLIQSIFPGLGGVKFLANMLRFAEIKQNTLPDMRYLGSYVAVINVKTLRELAKKVEMGYDTTQKYENVFCALQFLYRQRSKGQVRFICPVQHYAPPADYQKLDLLINKRRAKVKQFTRRVKDRLLTIEKPKQVLSNREYQDPCLNSHDTIIQTINARIQSVIQAENISPLQAARIVARISHEVLVEYLPSFSTSPLLRQDPYQFLPDTSKDTTSASTNQSSEYQSSVTPTTRAEKVSFPTTQRRRNKKTTSQVSKPDLSAEPEVASTPSKYTLVHNNQQVYTISSCTIGDLQAKMVRKDPITRESLQKALNEGRISPRHFKFMCKVIARNATFHQQSTSLDVQPAKTTPSAALSSQGNFFLTDQQKVVSSPIQKDDFPPYTTCIEVDSTAQNATQRKKVALSTLETDYSTQKDDFLLVEKSPAFKYVDEWATAERKKTTFRIPQTVTSLGAHEEIRNYVTLNIKKLIFNIYNNVTLRDKVLGQLFAEIFDKNIKNWIWYRKVIKSCSPDALLKAFITVIILLHENGSDTIKKPGALFISNCIGYQANKINYPGNYQKYEEMVYAEFVDVLRDHMLFGDGQRLA